MHIHSIHGPDDVEDSTEDLLIEVAKSATSTMFEKVSD